MKDIPLFTTSAGVAALTLSEIPYRFAAYVRLLDASEPLELLNECVQFCVMAGADHVFATGHLVCEKYPVHTSLLQMCRSKDGIGQTDAELIPVTENTLPQWREIYNERMHNIPNAATMTIAMAEKILQEGSGYFVYHSDLLLGIGVAAGERVDAVASVVMGAGKDVFRALCRVLTGERIIVEVAANNDRGCRLYRELGFTEIEEISKWYRVL